jgi:hypothetical protein
MLKETPAKAVETVLQKVYSVATGVDNKPKTRTGTSYLDATIYIFNSLSQPESGKQITLGEGLALIQESTHSVQIRQARQFGKGSSEYETTKKHHVPCFTWNVSSLEKHYRDSKNVRELNGLIYFDIDTPGITFEHLSRLPEFVAGWRSLGGIGYGFLVAVEGLTIDNFDINWRSIKARLAVLGLEIDEVASDPARANVLSNSEVLLAENVTPFQAVEPIFLPAPERRTAGTCQESNKSYTALKKGLDNKGVYFSQGKRHDYVFALAAGCNRVGIDQSDALDWMLEFEEPGFTADEISATVTDVYQRYSSSHGVAPMFVEEHESVSAGHKFINANVAENGTLHAGKAYLEDKNLFTFTDNILKKKSRESEYKKAPQQYVLKAGEHITHLALDHSESGYVDGSPGTGKSTSFLRSGLKYDFLVPTQDLAEQLAKKEGIDYVMAGLQPTLSDQQIGTYNALDKFLKRDTSDRILGIDEAHLLPKDQGYRSDVLNAILDEAPKYKALRLFSGTPVKSCHPLLKDLPLTIIRREEEPVKNWKLVRYRDRDSALIKRLEKGVLHTVVLQSKKKGERLAKLLKHKGYKVQCFNADTKKTAEHREVINTCNVGNGIDVLIVTGLFFQGINIDNTNIGSVHLLSDISRYDIYQLYSRFRNYQPETLFQYRSEKAEIEQEAYFNWDAVQQKNLAQAEYLAANMNVEEKTPDSQAARIAKLLVTGMAKEAVKPVRKKDGIWQVNYLGVDALTALEEQKQMHRNVHLMQKLLSKYNFQFAGIENDDENDDELAGHAKEIGREARKEEEKSLKTALEKIEAGGHAQAAQALNSDDPYEVTQGKRVLSLVKMVPFEQAVALLKGVKSNGKYQKIKRQVAAQLYKQSRKTDHRQTAETKLVDSILRLFNVGEVLTSEDALNRLNRIRNKTFRTKHMNLNENKAARILNTYFEVKRTTKYVDGVAENRYVIMGYNPLKIAVTACNTL